MAVGKNFGRRLRAMGSVAESTGDQSSFTLAFVGLCIFTFAIVTFRLPVAELGIVVGAVGLLLQRETLRAPAMVWWLAALVVWGFVASQFAPYTENSPTQLTLAAKLLAILFLAVNALRTPRQIHYFLIFFVGCFLAYPARGTLSNYFLYDYTTFGRALWNYAYANSNDLAAMSLLAIGAALAVSFSNSGKKFCKVFAAVSAVVFVFVVLLTQSRGGFIGLLAGFGPAAVSLLRKRKKGRFFVIPALLLVLLLTPADVWKRLSGIGELTSTETIARADTEGSAEQRWKIQTVGLDIFGDHAFWGVGLGGYGAANSIYAPDLGARDTHNTYLNIAAETGWPGLLLWGGMIISALRSGGRRGTSAPSFALQSEAAWVRRGLVAFLVAGLFGTYAYQSFTFLMMAALWSYAAASKLEDSVSQPQRLRNGRGR